MLWHLDKGLFDEQASSQDRIRTIFVIDCDKSPTVLRMFKEALNSSAARSDQQIAWLRKIVGIEASANYG